MSEVRLHLGDCLALLPELPRDAAIVSDPPYGMRWKTDSTRFSGGDRKPGDGREDWGEVKGDAAPFDPSPWIEFHKAVLWGANHYAARLPVGTTLIWLKKDDRLFGTFLSDAEIGWQKGGHGVYCFRKTFTARTRAKEAFGTAGYDLPPAHPTQKPLALMRWCIERLKLKPGTTIIDPYMGSGTTGVAAVQLGFHFVGIEIDPGHFATAERRINAARAETPLFSQA